MLIFCYIPTQDALLKSHREPVLFFSLLVKASFSIRTPHPSSLMDIQSNGQVHFSLSLQDMDYLCLAEV